MHERLWPALLNAVRVRSGWQEQGLSSAGRALLEEVGRRRAIRTASSRARRRPRCAARSPSWSSGSSCTPRTCTPSRAPIGSGCVAVGWRIRREGRKHTTGTLRRRWRAPRRQRAALDRAPERGEGLTRRRARAVVCDAHPAVLRGVRRGARGRHRRATAGWRTCWSCSKLPGSPGRRTIGAARSRLRIRKARSSSRCVASCVRPSQRRGDACFDSASSPVC